MNKKNKKIKKIKIEKEVRKLVKQYFATIEQQVDSGYLYQELIQRVERELIKTVIKKTDNNQSQAAVILGISRTTLRKKMAEFGLDQTTKPSQKQQTPNR